MAANCARRTLKLSSASTTAILSRTSSSSSSSSFASVAAKLRGLGSAKPTSASRLSNKLKISRLPVELGGAQSLMPLHSVTASALLTSLLSLNQVSWGCLSEGFAATL